MQDNRAGFSQSEEHEGLLDVRYILLLDNSTLVFSADRSISGGAAVQCCGSSVELFISPVCRSDSSGRTHVWTESDMTSQIMEMEMEEKKKKIVKAVKDF